MDLAEYPVLRSKLDAEGLAELERLIRAILAERKERSYRELPRTHR